MKNIYPINMLKIIVLIILSLA
ncbi:MAG: hypothetical protein K0R94_1615, partial [Burkholderiales bacterium]|nr:hypothetical protein [Burkholderiales bacterium]